MARIGSLDFRGFVAERQASGPREPAPSGEPARAGDTRARDDAFGYAYVSDRTTRDTFERLRAVEIAVAAAVRAFKSFGRAQLLGSAVKVSSRQFPKVHDVARHCATTLGIAVPTLYIVNSPTINAATYGTNDDAFILVHSKLVDHFSEEELANVIGHECGHIHNNHVVYLTAMHYLVHIASAFLQVVSVPATLALRGWSRRAEITCDRAGALCVGSMPVAERCLAKLALGSEKLYAQLDVDAFLAQHDESKQSAGRLLEAFASHPWLPKRILALRAFGDSALFRRHAGLGEGGATMAEVDQRVHSIIRVVG